MSYVRVVVGGALSSVCALGGGGVGKPCLGHRITVYGHSLTVEPFGFLWSGGASNLSDAAGLGYSTLPLTAAGGGAVVSVTAAMCWLEWSSVGAQWTTGDLSLGCVTVVSDRQASSVETLRLCKRNTQP